MRKATTAVKVTGELPYWVLYEICMKFFLERPKSGVDEQLSAVQSGFRKGRSTQDHIFTTKQLIETQQYE